MPNPAIAPALITAGGSLLGSLLEAFGAGAKRKEQKKWALDMLERIKPQGSYYGISRNLPTLDPIVMKAVLGNLSQRMGEGALGDWGIDLSQLLQGGGLSQGNMYKNLLKQSSLRRR